MIAQDKTALENKRAKILEEIRYTERLLNNTKKSVNTNISDLTALKRKISLRESLITSLNTETKLIDRQIVSNKAEVAELKNQLDKLKANYAESIVNSYKYQKSSQKFLFVLGAESFNQAVRRLNYIKKISSKRKEQAREIERASQLVKDKIAELEKMKEEKIVILAEEKLQLASLDNEKQSINNVIAELRKDEKKYQNDIKKKAAERAKLDREIKIIIEREIAAAEAARKPKTVGGLPSTPDPVLAQLSKDFYANKGKLPWPVNEGYISRSYGTYPHPELKNIEINNTGINIRTSDAAAVRAVFKGEVVTVMSNPTFKNAVIIKHGDYFSVYTGLGKVQVEKGTMVDTKQVIGTAFSDEDGVTEVHLEIWKGRTKTDPSAWIYKN
ncbi:MAG: peptidoglycan DD-metalloendopeptidase family protein [Chitinophagales bacterium]